MNTPRVVATVNFKGGVGKTTVTWLLARIASRELPCLVIDADAQMSLTTAVELSEETGRFPDEFDRWYQAHREKRRTLFDAIDKFTSTSSHFDFPVDGRVAYPVTDQLWLIPATSDLYWLALDVFDRDRLQGFVPAFLRKLMHWSRDGAPWRYVFFDCPPSFTVLSYSILTNCDLILVPVNPDVFADRGLDILLHGLELQLQPHPFPRVGVFMNRARIYRNRFTRECQHYWDLVLRVCDNWARKGVDITAFQTYVPERADIRKSIARGGRIPEHFSLIIEQLWTEVVSAVEG
jgi:chromosome partitioning protein